MSKERPVVLVSASGSGGHLMPALYISECLQEKGAEVAFVGSGRPLEKETFGRSGIPTYTIDISGLQNVGWRGVLRFAIRLPKAAWQCFSLFRKLRPDAVVGVGGYATFLPVLYGRLAGRPTWIHEAELQPGMANRVLAHVANRISLAFEETEFPQKEKTIFTGHPVRRDILGIAGRSKPVEAPSRLLVLGGSQGAKGIDDAMMTVAPLLVRLRGEVWHQCRPENQEKLKARYEELHLKAEVSPFIHELGKAYDWSDLVLSRAGAGAVMEVGVVNRPAILVPFPHAQGNHQLYNANVLVKQGKAILVEEGEGFIEGLQKGLEQLFDPDYYNKIRVRAGKKRPQDAARLIADELLAMIVGNGR